MGLRAKPKRRPPNMRRANDPRRHIVEMRAAFPRFTYRIGRDRAVTWEGVFQPNPSSNAYRISVVYELRGAPKVWIKAPPVPSNAPHRWPDGNLCLFWPAKWRWTDVESIPATIMGWAALWLEYYEIWRVLGVWLGPSSHDEFPEENNDA